MDATIWKVCGSIVVALILSVTGCTANRHYQIRALIENTGVDPIAAKCAIEGEVTQAPLCMASVSKN